MLPDDIWKPAVEATGGRFYPAGDEQAVLNAIKDIDLAVGRARRDQALQHAAAEVRADALHGDGVLEHRAQRFS